MYSYLKGEITEILATNITVEVGGIGYLVRVPNPYTFTLNSITTVYIHHHVREDAIELFGFATANEKQLFEKLISVKGLGPKGALAILAIATTDEIVAAIETGDSKFFAKTPGIGTKLSQQIILDLKGKVDLNPSENPNDLRIKEVSLALKTLGFNQADIKAVLKKINLTAETTSGEALKQALKMLRS